MKQIITTVTRGGQVTLPAEVRRVLGVKAQDRVAFSIEDGRVAIVAVPYTVATAAGSVRAPKGMDIDVAISDAKEEMARSLAGEQ